jgi:hypothetical protein
MNRVFNKLQIGIDDHFSIYGQLALCGNLLLHPNVDVRLEEPIKAGLVMRFLFPKSKQNSATRLYVNNVYTAIQRVGPGASQLRRSS